MFELVFEYADADALGRTLDIIRDPTGEIIDKRDRPVRCGTPMLMVQEIHDEQRHRKALH